MCNTFARRLTCPVLLDWFGSVLFAWCRTGALEMVLERTLMLQTFATIFHRLVFPSRNSNIHLFSIKIASKLGIGLLAWETFRISIYVGPLMTEVFLVAFLYFNKYTILGANTSS